jgi:hypothetical protein
VSVLLPVTAVQASIAANTYVISGPSQTKSAPPASLSPNLWPRICSALFKLKFCKASSPVRRLKTWPAQRDVATVLNMAWCCRRAAVEEMLPGILPQLGPEGIQELSKKAAVSRVLEAPLG